MSAIIYTYIHKHPNLMFKLKMADSTLKEMEINIVGGFVMQYNFISSVVGLIFIITLKARLSKHDALKNVCFNQSLLF